MQTNIASLETFIRTMPKVELHVIGYEGSLYDRAVELDFLARLRDIRRFGSVEQLLLQMDRDVAATRRIVEQYDSQRE